MSYDILGLGCVAVDETLVVERFPAEDAKVQVISRSATVGGTTATALLAAAKLGVRCAFVGTLGEDPASRLVLETFQQAGIDTSLIRREAAARPIRCTILISRASGSRTVLYDLQGAVPAVLGWPPADAVARPDCSSSISSAEGILPAARFAKSAGVPIVADLEHLEQSGDYTDYFVLADHVILSRARSRSIGSGKESSRSHRRAVVGPPAGPHRHGRRRRDFGFAR